MEPQEQLTEETMNQDPPPQQPPSPHENFDHSETIPLISGAQDDGAENQDENASAASKKAKSKNINLILVKSLIEASSGSLWTTSVLSNYVFLSNPGDPKEVGFLMGIIGTVSLIVSFPSGYFADKYRRDILIRISSILGLIAAGATVYSVSPMGNFDLLVVALCLWGVQMGSTMSPSLALFADSMEEGDRSYYYSLNMIMQTLGGSCGPVVSMLLFWKLGNTWTIQACAFVIMIAQALVIPVFILNWFLSDDYAVIEKEEKDESDDAEDSVEEASQQESDNDNDDPKKPSNEDTSSSRLVPILTSIGDFLLAVSSGMSFSYFPVFFLEDLKLAPIQVQLIYFLGGIFALAMVMPAQAIGMKLGRMQVATTCVWTSSLMLLGVIYSYKNGFQPWVSAAMYILYDSFLFAPYPLTRSVVMDHVPVNERGFWSAVESVHTFGWTGSAFLGGFVVGSTGVLTNFYISAACQLLATVPYVVLIVFGIVKAEDPTAATE